MLFCFVEEIISQFVNIMMVQMIILIYEWTI